MGILHTESWLHHPMKMATPQTQLSDCKTSHYEVRKRQTDLLMTWSEETVPDSWPV